MQRQEVLKKLRELKPTLQSEFDVAELALFGSVARDEATSESDIDLVVDFNGSPGMRKYFGLQFALEDSFKCEVDLVTRKSIRKELKARIDQDSIEI